MIEPISMSAVSWMLGAVGSGMANEAGRRAHELLGNLAARVTGRQVRAPAGHTEWDTLGRTLYEAALRDAAHARSLAALVDLVGTTLPGPCERTSAPAPLPPGVRSFTDRKDPMRRLTREASRTPDGRPRRVLVHGREGIGTSALAVQWAREHAKEFPGRALRVDLRGDGAGVGRDPAVALRSLLCGLGVAEEDLPPSADARTAYAHRLLEDRRMVLILDHAQSAAQVRPLLSGAPGVFTIVVARRPLPGLDAALVPVEPLTDRDATLLLKAVAGKAAVAAAGTRLPALLSRCAGSPYALHAAADGLLTAAAAPAEDIPEQQAVEGAGRAPEDQGPPAPRPNPGTAVVLEPGDGPSGEGDSMYDDPVRSGAEDAYARLPEDSARCYRLWALRSWHPLRPASAAAIADIPEDEAARLLAQLAQRQLLEGPEARPRSSGHQATDDGYHYREGVRRHAAAAAAREDGLAACARAVLRAVAHFLDFAVHADLAALPERWHLGPAYATATPGRYPDRGAALTALVAELGNLVEAARAAAEFEDWEKVAQFGEASWAAQLKAGRHDETLPLLRIATRVAREHFPATRMAGRLHAQFGLGLVELREFQEAEEALLFAAGADRDAGHLRGQATAVESLGLLRLRQWRWQEAHDCFEEAGALWDRVGPGDDGFADLARARALLHRHRGRALRGLDELPASLAQSHTALASFRAIGDVYNAARTLTDLAETHLKADAPQAALPLVDEALAVLEPDQATHHITHLRALRAQCEGRRHSAELTATWCTPRPVRTVRPAVRSSVRDLPPASQACSALAYAPASAPRGLPVSRSRWPSRVRTVQAPGAVM